MAKSDADVSRPAPANDPAPAAFDVALRVPKGRFPAGHVIGRFVPSEGIDAATAERLIRSHKTEFKPVG